MGSFLACGLIRLPIASQRLFFFGRECHRDETHAAKLGLLSESLDWKSASFSITMVKRPRFERTQASMAINRLLGSLAMVLAAASVAATGGAQSPACAQKVQPTQIDRETEAVVRMKMMAIPNARSNTTLGSTREGTGVVIDERGHIVTIGYIPASRRTGPRTRRESAKGTSLSESAPNRSIATRISTAKSGGSAPPGSKSPLGFLQGVDMRELKLRSIDRFQYFKEKPVY
jgi:hypothetical protein